MGAAVMLAIAIICTVNYTRNPDLIPVPAGLERNSASSSSFPGDAIRSKPELEPDRKITEVDCSKPVDLSTGNLRCK